MRSERTRIRLTHMLVYAESLIFAVKGKSIEDFPPGHLTTDGLIRRLEIIGEAASQIPPEFREKHTAIPWRDIVDLRNRIAHGYDTLNVTILWNIIHQDLPNVADMIRKILREDAL